MVGKIGFSSIKGSKHKLRGKCKKAAFTKPSRATSEARDERASTETLSGLRAEAEVVLAEAFASKAKTRNAVEGEQPSGFRCKRERWRLMRGAVSTLNIKAAFTLAEGATHTNMLQRVGNGFTLAEILITLAIIGVVAAMTIPTLIAKINSIVKDNQQKVFNAKIIKGMNLTKTAGDLNDTYDSTYDFLINGLGKNLKMAKICDSSHIRDCIPYDKITYEDKSGNEKTIDVKDITTASKLKLSAPYTDTAAFVLADGTPAIVSYNLKCIDDPDKADTSINACLAGIYDLNGTRKPNKFGTEIKDEKTSYTGDLISFNGAKLGNCSGVIGDVCFASTAVMADDAMLPLIQAVDPSYTMPKFTSGGSEYNDYWQLAVDYCDKVQGGKKLPDTAALAKVARVLYDNNTISDANSYNRKEGLNWNTNKAEVFSALGIESTASWFGLWSSQPLGTGSAYDRNFYSTDTVYSGSGRYHDNNRAVCLGD